MNNKPVEKQKPNGSILIIDDQPTNLQMLGTVLRHTNYEIVFASSGKAGLKKIYNDHPDLILLDIRMPEMDGWQVIDELKSNRSTKDIPVIFLSGMTEEDDVNRCFEKGAVDYIAKPFKMVELLARVNTHFSLKRANDQIVELKEKLRQYTDSEGIHKV